MSHREEIGLGRVVPGKDGQTVDIRVPMEFKTRSGRKEIISVGSPSGLPPDAATTADVGPRSPLVVALARAYRWQRMLDDGHVKSLDDLAAQVGVDRSYVGRTLRLAALAPSIVEAVVAVDGPEDLSLDRLKRPFPSEWDRQRAIMGF